MIGPLLGAAPPAGLAPAVLSGRVGFGRRWNVAFVVSPGFPEFEARARMLGFPEIARSDRGDLAVVYGVPDAIGAARRRASRSTRSPGIRREGGRGRFS